MKKWETRRVSVVRIESGATRRRVQPQSQDTVLVTWKDAAGCAHMSDPARRTPGFPGRINSKSPELYLPNISKR